MLLLLDRDKNKIKEYYMDLFNSSCILWNTKKKKMKRNFGMIMRIRTGKKGENQGK